MSRAADLLRAPDVETSAVHRLGARLWGRHRRRFVPWLVATITGLVILGLFAPAVAIGSTYLGLGWTGGLVWWATAVGATIVTQVVVTWSIRAIAAPIRQWGRGDHSDPEAAWAALVLVPQVLGARSFLFALPFHGVLSAPFVVGLADPGATGLAGLLVAYPLVAGTCGLLFSTAAQLLVRAAADDVASHAPPIEVVDHGAWSIRRRLFVVILVIATLAGGAAPPIVLGRAVTETDYVVALVGGGAFAAYLALIVDVGLLQPLLTPLREVIAATTRVRRGDVTQSVPVATFDELGHLAAAFNQMQRGLREREALHTAFGSYVDPALAQRLIESGSSVFEGEDLLVTVLFADVRNFTSYAERVEPAEAVALLNRLFDVVVPVLHEHGGHANHYLGDGLLAVFGAPNPLEHHADAAVRAAKEIQRRVAAELDDELRIGIGINTGRVIAGTVGGGGRHEFTVIGDTVNAAARVEQLTKDTGDAILITEATRGALSTPRPRTTKRGAFELRGKANRTTLYAVAVAAPRSGGRS